MTADVNLVRYRATQKDHLTRNASQRLLSAEIEICGTKQNHQGVTNAVSAWHGGIVTDGSLPGSGVEINTHPASGDFWIDQVTDICTALADAKAHVDGRAGCHTHVDATDLGYLGLSRVLRLAACVEPALFLMLPPARRTSRYCEYWASQYLRPIHAADTLYANESNPRKQVIGYRKAILDPLYGSSSRTDMAKARQTKNGGSRYRAVNVHSWFYRGTLEFRMPPGTIYAANIINWGLLLGNLVDLGAYRSADEIKVLTKDVETHIRERNAYVWRWSNVTVELQEKSTALLLALAPTDAVRDWVKERIQYMRRFTDETSYREDA